VHVHALADPLAGPTADVYFDVLSWRFSQLRRAGYAGYEAFLLATRSHVDVHQAVELLRAGCPSETALRILL
jgi:hypothetical protein